MTELEYLRAELIAAKHLLATCEGHMMVDQAAMPAPSRAETIQKLREFAKRGVHVLPDDVKHGSPSGGRRFAIIDRKHGGEELLSFDMDGQTINAGDIIALPSFTIQHA